MVCQNKGERVEDVKVLVEIYKTFRDEITKLKKNVSDAYRIYLPALFGLIIAFDKIYQIYNFERIYLAPFIIIIEIFALITYGQVVYDLTDIACISVKLRFIEKLINDKFGKDIVTWEEDFSEPFKMICPQKMSEKVLYIFYMVIMPNIIAFALALLVISILGYQTIPLILASSLIVAIVAVTLFIGFRRLGYAKKFAEEKKLCKNED